LVTDVTIPLAFTLISGTLKISPYAGVAFAVGPYSPAVTPESPKVISPELAVPLIWVPSALVPEIIA
jgi:hypothetical protein